MLGLLKLKEIADAKATAIASATAKAAGKVADVKTA
jgi:hypothetical protein